MTRLLTALLLTLALIASACVTTTPAGDGPRPAETDPVGYIVPGPVRQVAGGVQLVTENYLRMQMDRRVLAAVDELLVEILWERVGDHPYPYPWSHTSALSTHWDKDRRGIIDLRVETYYPTVQTAFHHSDMPWRMTLTFDRPNYDSGGHVEKGNCVPRPNSGDVVTSGQYDYRVNGTSEPDHFKVEKSVTETKSRSVTLAESLELSSGQELEAGTDVAKAKISFSETFGISKSETDDVSESTTLTVADEIDVDPYRSVTAAFTLDYLGQDCDVDINAIGDYGNLTWTLPFNDGDWTDWIDSPNPGSNYCGSRLDGHRGHNGDILFASDVVDRGKCRIVFAEFDDLIRLILGYDVRCPDCKNMLFSAESRAVIKLASDTELRHVTFKGVQHEASHQSASVEFRDVTGEDPNCVADALGKVDEPYTGALDDCK